MKIPILQRKISQTALAFVAMVALSTRGLDGSQAQAPYGAASPQEAASAVASALAQSEYGAAVAYIAPKDREELVAELVTDVLEALEQTNPNHPLSRSLSPGELEAKLRNHAAARQLFSARMEKHKFVDLFSHPSYDGKTQLRIHAGIALSPDSVVVLGDLFAAMREVWALVWPTELELALIPFELTPVSNVKVRGDTATARSARRRLDFVRTEGRWYLRIPPTKPSDFF